MSGFGLPPARPSAVPDLAYDVPVAVIGDIHGRSDLLERLLDALPDNMPVLVVGDLCDRGPDSRGVIDRLVARGARGVRGNHDEWLADWATGRRFDRFALHPAMGGEATLASYGVDGRSTAAVEAQAWRVPVAHRDWLDQLPVAAGLTVCGEPYWMAHAGVPSTIDLRGVALAAVVPFLAQHQPASLLWAKNDPVDMLPLDRTIVMGHVPLPAPLDTGAVLAIDTGSGTTRRGGLTAVILPERRFVTVR